MKTVRVVKRKWDRSVAARIDTAPAAAGPDDTLGLVHLRRQSPGQRPRVGTVEVTTGTSSGLRSPGSGGCCAATWTWPVRWSGYKVHATAPFEAPAQ